MKVIKTIAMVVGAVALVATGVGAVVGGPAFLAATGVSLETVSAIGAVAGLVGTVANAISPPKAAKGTVGGSQTDFKLDPNAGIPYLMGRTYAGGNIVHRETWGKDNQYQGFVVTYSGAGTLQAFENFQVDRTPYAIGGGGALTGTYAGWMWAALALAATPAAALASPVAGFPGFGPTFKMSGHATNVTVLKFDVKKGKKFSNGVPRMGVVALGERVYDPRQDSTFPGGNGPCRALQEDTYVGGAPAENPWLHALTFALGRHQNGHRVLGVGQALSSIHVPSFVEAANVADANGWKCGGVVYSIDDKWDVLRQLAQAGGGQCLRLGARLSCVVNAPRVALATVTDDDLVEKGSVSAALTYRERLNGMVPKFRSEANGWEIVPASTVRVGAYVAFDGEEKTAEWPLPLVQDATQAGVLTAYELVNRREFGPISLPLYIRFLGYKPGDALNLNVGKLGLVNQLAIVRKRQINPENGNVLLQCVSETTSKHPFALGQTTTAPAIPSLAVPDESVVPPPQAADWSAVGGELEKDGVKTPAIFLSGDVRLPTANGFLVEIRPVGAADWTTVGTFPAQTERVDIVSVASGAAYYVGVSFIRRGVIGERLQLPDPVAAGLSVAAAANAVPDGGTIGGQLDPVTGEVTGGRTVVQIVADLAAATAGVADLEGDIDDLIATYGNTASSAANAAAANAAAAGAAAAQALAAQAFNDAAAARDAAVNAKNLSEAASGVALAARDAANTASEQAFANAQASQTYVGQASGFAATASGAAATATQRATEAGQSAVLADASYQGANTARGGAEAARDLALTSSASAAGSASAAAASQLLSADTYSRALQLVGNGNFAAGLDGWETSRPMLVVAAYDGRANTVRTTDYSATTVMRGPAVPITSGDQRFRLKAGLRSSGGDDPQTFYVGYVCHGPGGVELPHIDGTGNYPLFRAVSFTSGQGWQDRSVVVGPGAPPASPYGGTTAFPAGATSFQPLVYLNYFGAPAPTDIDYFTVEDVTALAQAGDAAAASAASAAAASASQTLAGQSATAAETSRQLAQTAQGLAEAARSAAAASETNAAGSASSALSSSNLSASARDASQAARDLAAGYRDTANAAASASASSAAAASASQTLAGQSATAADQAKVAAQTAKGLSEAARDTAVSSASSAAGSASAAAASQVLTAQTFDKAAQVYGNGTFDLGTAGWEVYPSAGTIAVPNFTGRSNTVRTPAGVAVTLVGPSVAVSAANQRWRLRSSFRCSGGVASMTFFAGYFAYDVSATLLSAYDGSGNFPLCPGQSFTSAQDWQDREVIVGPGSPPASPYGGTSAFPAGTASFRPVVFMNYTALPAPADIDYFTVQDVTSEQLAAAAATASSASASAASASQGLAAASATASSGFRDAAQVQAGNAASSASSAAGSAAASSSSAAAASASQTLSAAFAATRGMTPNGDFSAGLAGWSVSQMYAAAAAGYGEYLATTAGQAGSAYQQGRTAVDASGARRYRLTAKFVVHAAACINYAGLNCFDAAGTDLGNIYMDAVVGQNFPGGVFYTKTQIYQGTNAALNAPPYYTSGGQFPVGTVSVRALHLANYTAAAGSYQFLQDLFLEDVTESYQAGLSASAAAASSAAASASAAQAQSSYVLSAQLAIGSLNKNGNFTGMPNPVGGGMAPFWSIWAAEGVRYYQAGGVDGPDAYYDNVEPGSNQGIYQDFNAGPGSYVASAAVQCLAGNLLGAGLLIYAFDGGGTFLGQATVSFGQDADISGTVYPGGDVGDSGKLIRFAKLVSLPWATTKTIRIYNMSNWASQFGPATAWKSIKWHSSGLRPAADVERVAGAAIPALQASVSTVQAAQALIDGRTQAYWQVSAKAGGTSASIEARAMTNPDGSTSSRVGIVAEEFSVTSTSAGIRRRVMRVLGSDVLIDGNLSASAGVFLGSGAKWTYQLKTKTFAVSDGTVVAFGVDLGSPPAVDFSTTGLAALAAGETYRLYADSLTSTGFIARLRIVIPGTSAAYNITASTTPGSGPTRQIALGANPQANSGNYTFVVGGTYTGNPEYVGGGGNPYL